MEGLYGGLFKQTVVLPMRRKIKKALNRSFSREYDVYGFSLLLFGGGKRRALGLVGIA